MPETREERYQGLGLSGGVATSRVCLFNDGRHEDLPRYRVREDRRPHEQKRFDDAVSRAGNRLETIRDKVRERIGEAEAEIFSTQLLILDDAALRRKVHTLVEGEGLNAEAAADYVLDDYEARLRKVNDEYLRERASDIGEVRQRILDALRDTEPGLRCAGQAHCMKGRDRIVIARELTPSMTVDLDLDHTRGFVTERGGRHAHAAILARSLDIPAVSGIPGLHERAVCGTEVVVNGDSGEVILHPSAQTLDQLAVRKHKKHAALPIPPVEGLRIMANISSARDIETAVAMQAEGIGLYRTELEFIAAGRLLDQEEQYRMYSAALQAFKGLPVTFRLLDAGSDKPLPSLALAHETNPALGLRGARFLLKHRELLRIQAKALARATRHGPLRVLYPMIVDADQFLTLRALVEEEVGESGKHISHGVMFEVPAAFFRARELFAAADFGSVGSNDLVQYLFAVDRDNTAVADDYPADHPVFRDVLAGLAEAAEERDRPLSLCGEMASETEALHRLRQMGYKEISVSPRAIPMLRNAVRGLS